MPEYMPAHAILSVMRDLAEQAADAPMETLCIAFANLLQDPRFQELDEDLFGQLVLLGAGLWRHTDGFKGGAHETVQ